MNVVPLVLLTEWFSIKKYKTYLKIVYVLLLHAELSFNLWEDTLLTTCHIFNRISMKKIKLFHINCRREENLIWIF